MTCSAYCFGSDYDILENGTDEAVKAICTIKHTFGEASLTLDNAMLGVRNEFYYNMVFTPLNYGTQENPLNISFWVSYSEMSDLREFMALVCDLLMAAYKNIELDASAVQAALESFRALKNNEQTTFHFFGLNYYYDTLMNFFTKDGTPEDFVRAVLQAEIGYVEYMKDTTDPGRLEYFDKIMKAAADEFDKLDPEQQNELDELLMSMYNYYIEKYEQAIAE